MRIAVEHEKYNTLLVIDDWRYAAATLGIIKYFEFCKSQLQAPKDIYTTINKINDDCTLLDEEMIDALYGLGGIMYNQENIKEEYFLDFAEDYWKMDMPHKNAENILNKDSVTEEEIQRVNDYLTGKDANTILKKVFKGVKFDGSNADIILALLEENRYDVIKSTYCNKSNMYANFANRNLLLSDTNAHCRLLGYCVDENRKSKGVGYNFNKDMFESKDSIELDFIPFAFTKTRDSIFINCNESLKLLKMANEKISDIIQQEQKETNINCILLKAITASDEFLQNDVEIILKRRENEYFQTMFIRKKAIKSLTKLAEYSSNSFHYHSKDWTINVEAEVFDAAINNMTLDALIEKLLKQKIKDETDNLRYLSKVIESLIKLNVEWKEGSIMENKYVGQEKKTYQYFTRNENIEKAREKAFVTSIELLKKPNGKQKLKSYSQKLCNALVFHDYDRVKEILLQLSTYVEVTYPFIYRFLEDAEENKEIVFAFANGLDASVKSKETKVEDEI